MNNIRNSQGLWHFYPCTYHASCSNWFRVRHHVRYLQIQGFVLPEHFHWQSTSTRGRQDLVDAVVKATGAGNKAGCNSSLQPRLSLRPSRSRASLMTFTVFKIENVAFCIHYLARKLGPIVQEQAGWLLRSQNLAKSHPGPGGRPWTSPMLSIRRWWTPCWKLSGKRPRSQWAAGGKPDFQGPQIWQLTTRFWWIDPVRSGTLKVVGVNTWESRWSLLDSGGGSRP